MKIGLLEQKMLRENHWLRRQTNTIIRKDITSIDTVFYLVNPMQIVSMKFLPPTKKKINQRCHKTEIKLLRHMPKYVHVPSINVWTKYGMVNIGCMAMENPSDLHKKLKTSI